MKTKLVEARLVEVAPWTPSFIEDVVSLEKSTLNQNVSTKLACDSIRNIEIPEKEKTKGDNKC